MFIEQDKLYPFANDDRNYTMGVGLQFGGELGYTTAGMFHPWRLTSIVPAVRNVLDEFTLGHRLDGRVKDQAFSWMLGVTAFTPDSLATAGAIDDDRPYASLVFLSSRRTRVSLSERWAVRSELAVGWLGGDIARSVQTWLHANVIDGDAPLGWANQISDGGELTGLYGIEWEYLPRMLNADAGTADRDFEHSVRLGGQFGYYQNLTGSVSVRAGRVRSAFWEWDSNPLGSQNQLSLAEGARGEDHELFAFAALRGRLVRHNSLLEGQWRNREGAPTVEAEPLVLGGEAGASWAFTKWGRPIRATWVMVAGRSPEFKDAAERRSHLWGSIFLTFGTK